jgi:hypothetical protein
MAERGLPIGMTPRLLSRDAAATYCGMSANHFEEHVAKAVQPLHFGKRYLWDIRALDRWLDQRSGLTHAVDTKSIGERLNGRDQGARR